MPGHPQLRSRKGGAAEDGGRAVDSDDDDYNESQAAKYGLKAAINSVQEAFAGPLKGGESSPLDTLLAKFEPYLPLVVFILALVTRFYR